MRIKFALLLAVVCMSAALANCSFANNFCNVACWSNQYDSAPASKWMAGDFHTHTWLSDGTDTQTNVVYQAFVNYGLDWMANSEHGGQFGNSPFQVAPGTPIPWSAYTPQEGLPAYNPLGSPAAGKMWRWQSLRDFSFPIIQALRKVYPDKVLVQGYEWNAPGHEHVSVGIVGEAECNGTSIALHEYLFDQNDAGTSSGAYLGAYNKTPSTNHAKTLEGVAWLQNNFKKSSYVVINHPSRKLKYSAADIRDMIDAAPDVVIGMEGFPGHQQETYRGGYGVNFGDKTYLARTYGGADYMTAKVGGLWDALLGEGRRFWIFVNSDYHTHGPDADFYPGEYAKTWTFVKDIDGDGFDAVDIVNGLKSGNSYCVHGDLINRLDFACYAGNRVAVMGEELAVKPHEPIFVQIRTSSPARNNNGDPVKLHHIDLIMGLVTSPAKKGTPEYAKDTNETTRVIARFDKSNWKVLRDGSILINYRIKNPGTSFYLRLRGTNLAPNTPNETDEFGNPLIDDLAGIPNTAAKAYADLWFYSNPIFVKVGR